MSESGPKWIKSTASLSNGACIELAVDDPDILLRNSRQPDVQLRFTRAEIAAFLVGVRNNEFDGFASEKARTPPT
jgi:hypothetical protein